MQTKLMKAIGLAAALALAGCGNLLDVTNPGPILDEELNRPEAIPGLVVGMSRDLSQTLAGSGTQSIVLMTALLSGEFAHSGSYPGPGLYYRGILNPEDVNTVWAQTHQARWVAESGIERARAILGEQAFAKHPDIARAYLLAGLSNRVETPFGIDRAAEGGAS